MSVYALYGEANALYWKSSERQNSTHITLLKHQNIKTPLHKFPKNHCVIALLEIFGSVRKKLLLTVLLDHADKFHAKASSLFSSLPSIDKLIFAKVCQLTGEEQACSSEDQPFGCTSSPR